MFRCKMLRMVSAGCNSILPCANRLEQAAAKITAIMSDKRFMIASSPQESCDLPVNSEKCNDRAMSASPREDIPSNLEWVLSQIAEAAKKSGRSLDDIELV